MSFSSDNIYTDGCVYYFINVPKIIDDYFKKQKLSILEKLIIILGVDDKKEMKKVAGENTRLIDLVNKINEEENMNKENKFTTEEIKKLKEIIAKR